jgi:uncharacterized membrane protein
MGELVIRSISRNKTLKNGLVRKKEFLFRIPVAIGGFFVMTLLKLLRLPFDMGEGCRWGL